MELVIKCCAAAVAAALLALTVKKSNPEMALSIALIAAVVIACGAVKAAGELGGFVGEVAEMSELSDAVLGPVLKCVGIAIVVKLCSDVCKDAGQQAVASTVEIMGAVCALYVSLPLFESLLDMLEGML